jgi:hypothetical protein
MTKKQLFKKLKASGIPKGTSEWQDYELGKSIFNGKYMQTLEYENFIKWLSEYCNV